MLTLRRQIIALIVLLGSTFHGVVQAQDGCESPFQFPFGTFSPDPSGLVTEISTCIYFQEYTHFTGFVSGSTYRFDISGEGYITLREGTVDGPVVAAEYGYVIYTATSNADIFAHYTKNADCVLTTGCQISSVQLLLDCIPAQVWYEWVEDCTTGEFFIDVEVIALGDSPSVTIAYASPGNSGSVPDAGLGITQIGPFTLSDVVDITVIHGSSAGCDINFNGLQPFPTCPILLDCGGPASNVGFCYENSGDVAWSFQGVGSGSILIDFLAGNVGGGDLFTIYDGADASAPVLFAHTDWNQLELAGVSWLSSGPDLYITLISDGFGSCADFSNTALDFNVACLDCNQPQVTAVILDDCANNQFSIGLDIASTGDGNTVDVEYTVNGGTVLTMSNVGTGQTILGPFTINDLVLVDVLHENDGMCDISLGTLTDGNSCPTLIICGEGDLIETYCYVNFDSQFWFYELVGNDGALYLQFNAGSIESANFDPFAIYDGIDATAPLLFQHTGGQLQLAGIAVTSTSGYLYMEMSSDGSVSCEDGFQTSWEWIVTCLDCTPAEATFQIVQDCENFQFYVEVDLADIGSDPELTIINNGGAPEVNVTAPGVVQVGPFTSGVPVQLTLVNDDDALCNVVSPIMVNPLCPTIICGTTPLEETYCYAALEDMAWAYELPGAGQLRLVFNLGTIESSFYDVLTIYDGPDAQSPILFQHTDLGTAEFGPQGSAVNGPGLLYYAVDVTSTGANLYMTLTSDGSVECTSSFFDEMQWDVFCEGCPAPGVSYQLEADCEHLIYKATVEVTEVNGPLGLQITELISGETVTATEPNTFNFTTFFDLDSLIYFEVVDMDNVGCTYESGPMVYTRDSCVINSCGTDNYTLCYENDEDRWYTYRSEGNYPVAIYLYQGQMLANDFIVLYNGLSDTASVIFSGNNGGNLAGITANSSNPDHALTLRIRSNADGSCADGAATTPLHWDVGCGYVGVDEVEGNGFSLYPNPATNTLNIDLGNPANGPLFIRVMDMSGRTVHEQGIADGNRPRMTMDVSMLQSGQYLIQLIAKDRIATRTFQLMR